VTPGINLATTSKSGMLLARRAKTHALCPYFFPQIACIILAPKRPCDRLSIDTILQIPSDGASKRRTEKS